MVVSIILLIITIILNLLLGSSQISWHELLHSDILWQLRLPRTMIAVSAGAVLALAGHLSQILFRNSLATPYTLGIASAAGLGAILAMSLGLSWSLVGASALAVSSLGLIFLSVAYSKSKISSNSLLLLGIALNLFCGGVISILQVSAGKLDLSLYLSWVMGSVSVVGMSSFFHLIIPAMVLLTYSILNARNLSLMAIEGDTYTRGFNPRRLRFVLLGMITLVIAVLVSDLGPIGFIGLVIPHMSKRFYAVKEHSQIWGCVILGALTLVAADLINRTLLSPLGLPVGVVTTTFGAPALAYIIWRKH